jgi:hypothetical protein
MFEERVLMRIFGPKRFEVTWEWRKLRKKRLYDLYFTPNTIRVIKSRRMRWAGHVATYGGEERYIRNIGGEIWRKETT